MTFAAALLAVTLISLDPDPSPVDTGSGTNDDSFWVAGQKAAPQTSQVLPDQGSNIAGPAILATGADGCGSTPGVVGLPGGESTTCTVTVGEPDEQPQAITIGMVRRAFARLPLPASTLVIQPPDGLTLVNLLTSSKATRAMSAHASV